MRPTFPRRSAHARSASSTFRIAAIALALITPGVVPPAVPVGTAHAAEPDVPDLSSNDPINRPIYDLARDDYRDLFIDIKAGTNGACGSVCTAAPGYDFVTGLGSPRAKKLVDELDDY